MREAPAIVSTMTTLGRSIEEIREAVEYIKTMEASHHAVIGHAVIQLHDSGEWRQVRPDLATWAEFVEEEFDWSERQVYNILNRARLAVRMGLTKNEQYPTFREADELRKMPEGLIEEAIEQLAEDQVPMTASLVLKQINERIDNPVASKEAWDEIEAETQPYSLKFTKDELKFLETIPVRDKLRTAGSKAIFDSDAVTWKRAFDDHIQRMQRRGLGKGGQGVFCMLLAKVYQFTPYNALVCMSSDSTGSTCHGGYTSDHRRCESCKGRGYHLPGA